MRSSRSLGARTQSLEVKRLKVAAQQPVRVYACTADKDKKKRECYRNSGHRARVDLLRGGLQLTRWSGLQFVVAGGKRRHAVLVNVVQMFCRGSALDVDVALQAVPVVMPSVTAAGAVGTGQFISIFMNATVGVPNT